MLSAIEKETIILFNESEKEAEIFTYNKSMIKKFDKYAQERPDEVKVVKIYDDGAKKYIVPKEWILKLSAPRKVNFKDIEQRKKRLAK